MVLNMIKCVITMYKILFKCIIKVKELWLYENNNYINYFMTALCLRRYSKATCRSYLNYLQLISRIHFRIDNATMLSE